MKKKDGKQDRKKERKKETKKAVVRKKDSICFSFSISAAQLVSHVNHTGEKSHLE